MTVHIKNGGNNPTHDGDINLYHAKDWQQHGWFDRNRRVVFINGMLNDEEAHATGARALSMTQACPVIGIYNKTDGGMSDFGQCIRDKLTLVVPQAANFDQWKLVIDAGYLVARELNKGLSKLDYVAKLIDGNKATLAMYRYFTSLSQSERSNLKVYSHSQGNLITSNALTATQLALGKRSISQLEVNSYGSPCRFWPNEIKHNNYAHTFDPVAMLDARMGFTTSKVGFTGVDKILGFVGEVTSFQWVFGPIENDPMYAHAFLTYLSNDAEFVVNRYRWGSFGMTASMDEAGLALFLIRAGDNSRRIRLIFERLKKAHWTDSDDVAHIYVKNMRLKHDHVMKSHARTDKKLITLLIDLLESGWTTGGEYKEIDYLKSL
jgi:hypothetical protein